METLNKLNESKYLLGQLNINYTNDKFDFYVNAFITSARSITWNLQREFSSDETFKIWYNSKEPTDKDLVLMKQITKLRNYSQKEYALRHRKIIGSIGDWDPNINYKDLLGATGIADISAPDEDGDQTLNFYLNDGKLFTSKIDSYERLLNANGMTSLQVKNLCSDFFEMMKKLLLEWKSIYDLMKKTDII